MAAMRFANATVNSVKADLAKKEITLTFRVDLSEEEPAEELARYVDVESAGTVELNIKPRQLSLTD